MGPIRGSQAQSSIQQKRVKHEASVKEPARLSTAEFILQNA